MHMAHTHTASHTHTHTPHAHINQPHERMHARIQPHTLHSQTHTYVSCANNVLTVLCRQDLLHWLDSVSKLIKAPYKIEKV